MAVIFGKPFERSFSVEDGEGNIASVNSLVSARIYSDSPSEAQIEDSAHALADAVESVTSWSTGESPLEKRISYSALTDSSEHSTSNATYYEVISFAFASGGATKFVVRPFTVIRPHSIESRIKTAPADIAKLESKVYDVSGKGLKSASWVQDRIAVAKQTLLRRLEGMSIPRRYMKESDLENAMLFKSAALCCLSLATEAGDIWERKYELYDQEFENILRQEQIGVDINKSGHITPTESRRGGANRFVR